jgi:hypothetical protein
MKGQRALGGGKGKDRPVRDDLHGNDEEGGDNGQGETEDCSGGLARLHAYSSEGSVLHKTSPDGVGITTRPPGRTLWPIERKMANGERATMAMRVAMMDGTGRHISLWACKTRKDMHLCLYRAQPNPT